jgi:hypothetical protein
MTTCKQPASDADWPAVARISKLPLAECQRTRLRPHPHQQPCTPLATDANTGQIFPHAPFAWESCDPGSEQWTPYLLGDYAQPCAAMLRQLG